MEAMTISQVSKSLGISTRMLRYHEQAGLIRSLRREGYAYRIYDEEAVSRLKQILLLRKLRIPVRQIKLILQNPNAAAAHHIGDDPESHVNELIDRFVRETELHKRKPDLRHYGFNHPNPADETGFHGYETWVTIPDDMEVPAPLVKKRFAGGLYAAHMIAFGNFNEWEALLSWVAESKKYEFAGDMRDQEHMCGLLEEHLNYASHVELPETEPEDLQLDLLIPVREK